MYQVGIVKLWSLNLSMLYSMRSELRKAPPTVCEVCIEKAKGQEYRHKEDLVSAFVDCSVGDSFCSPARFSSHLVNLGDEFDFVFVLI